MRKAASVLISGARASAHVFVKPNNFLRQVSLNALKASQFHSLSQTQFTPARNLIPFTQSLAGFQYDSRRTMFIQTQSTPNPNSLMFVPGKPVMEKGTHEFQSARAAMSSPLAKKLFTIDGVATVFFGTDFVTVTKKDDYTWAILKPDIFASIMDFYTSSEPLFYDETSPNSSDTTINPEDSEIVAMIKELLETRIRPAIQEDGGDIQYRGFDEDSGTVYVKLVGACSSCPSSSITLKSGVSNMLKHYIPEVKNVEEVGPDEYEEEGLRHFAEIEKKIEKKIEGGGASCSSSPKEEEEEVKKKSVEGDGCCSSGH